MLLNGTPLAPVQTAGGPSPAGPGPAAGGSGGPSAGPPPAARFKLVGRPRLRGRVLTVVLRLPGRGALALKATAKVRSRTRVLGALRKSIPAAGRRTLKLKLKRKAPARLRLAITFTPSGGARQTRRVTVRRR